MVGKGAVVDAKKAFLIDRTHIYEPVAARRPKYNDEIIVKCLFADMLEEGHLGYHLHLTLARSGVLIEWLHAHRELPVLDGSGLLEHEDFLKHLLAQYNLLYMLPYEDLIKALQKERGVTCSWWTMVSWLRTEAVAALWLPKVVDMHAPVWR